MKLTWYGHACFKLETEQGSVVLDPYEPEYVPGLDMGEPVAELCLCSHYHHDHGYSQGVKLSGRTSGLKITTIPVFHDEKQGALRGENLLHLIEAEGKRVLHLGDLGHMLSPELIAQLRGIDLLLIPVGGTYTIDALQAAELAKALEPKLCIPMHYKGEGFGFDVLLPVEDFLAHRDNIIFHDSSLLDLDKQEGPATIVLRCPTKK